MGLLSCSTQMFVGRLWQEEFVPLFRSQLSVHDLLEPQQNFFVGHTSAVRSLVSFSNWIRSQSRLTRPRSSGVIEDASLPPDQRMVCPVAHSVVLIRSLAV